MTRPSKSMIKKEQEVDNLMNGIKEKSFWEKLQEFNDQLEKERQGIYENVLKENSEVKEGMDSILRALEYIKEKSNSSTKLSKKVGCIEDENELLKEKIKKLKDIIIRLGGGDVINSLIKIDLKQIRKELKAKTGKDFKLNEEYGDIIGIALSPNIKDEELVLEAIIVNKNMEV